MTLGWTSGAMSVALTSIQLAGVQPVESLLSLLEVSGLLTPTVIEYLYFNAVSHIVIFKGYQNYDNTFWFHILYARKIYLWFFCLFFGFFCYSSTEP